MDRKEFLDIVKGFSREDFKKYLYREINGRKRKLLVIIERIPNKNNKK